MVMAEYISHLTSEYLQPSNYGWRVKFDHIFPERRSPNFKPRLHQVPPLIGLAGRYILYYLTKRFRGEKPFIDVLNLLDLKQIYGVPIGGIGCGTIGRGFRGEFCRFQLIPGYYEYSTAAADQFIVCVRREGITVYQEVLTVTKPKNVLKSWSWNFKGSDAEYCALYPCSWTTFDLPEQNIRLICKQISPVIPDNYKDSSLPCAVFQWSIENNTEEGVEVSIIFTFEDGIGRSEDIDNDKYTKLFECENEDVITKGILLSQKLNNMDCTYGIAAVQKENVNLSFCDYFNPLGNGEELWNEIYTYGQLNDNRFFTEELKHEPPGRKVGVAVCAQCFVDGKKTEELEFSLAWHMPQIQFNKQGQIHNRFYTKWFGIEIEATVEILTYALSRYHKWETDIVEWQKPILENKDFPDWYKSAIFNELYFISDGGTVWVEYPHDETQQVLPGDVRREYGRFAYLEGHEYRMYNTYDVHFYASFALIKLWPKLQLSLQYDMNDAVYQEDLSSIKYLMDGSHGPRKTANMVPHDLGFADEEPWLKINSYLFHDTSNWKDLNLKFILQVYRDYIFTKDYNYLKNMWPTVLILISRSKEWDKDGDGLIENSGFADQTYDCWTMTGPSAYCSGLWIASIKAVIDMGIILEFEDSIDEYKSLLLQAKASYNEKLWTGSYYKFDCSDTPHALSIMSDQLCGCWYLNACQANDEVFPKENILNSLKTIYENNVLRFKNGTMGAVNGMLPDGNIDCFTMESEEAWVGVTYALAATMIQEGMIEEGFRTAEGMYNSLYNILGMAFQTPEALYEHHYYRSLGYMRPLSIWAIQCALEQHSSNS